MHMLIRCFLSFILLLIALPAQAATGEPSTREEFEMFWEKFTDAVKDLGEDHIVPLDPAVMAYVDFPFTSRGNMDFDPERTYTREALMLALPKLLESDVGTTELPTPMSEYLLQKLVFSDQDILAGDVRVGNFKFHKTHGYWKWYFAYYDTSPTP